MARSCQQWRYGSAPPLTGGRIATSSPGTRIVLSPSLGSSPLTQTRDVARTAASADPRRDRRSSSRSPSDRASMVSSRVPAASRAAAKNRTRTLRPTFPSWRSSRGSVFGALDAAEVTLEVGEVTLRGFKGGQVAVGCLGAELVVGGRHATSVGARYSAFSEAELQHRGLLVDELGEARQTLGGVVELEELLGVEGPER